MTLLKLDSLLRSQSLMRRQRIPMPPWDSDSRALVRRLSYSQQGSMIFGGGR